MHHSYILILDNQTSSLPEIWSCSSKGGNRVRKILTEIGIKDEIDPTVGLWKVFHAGKFILCLLTIIGLCSSLLRSGQGFRRNIYPQNTPCRTNRLSKKRRPQSWTT